jgi:hypothetical protein
MKILRNWASTKKNLIEASNQFTDGARIEKTGYDAAGGNKISA